VISKLNKEVSLELHITVWFYNATSVTATRFLEKPIYCLAFVLSARLCNEWTHIKPNLNLTKPNSSSERSFPSSITMPLPLFADPLFLLQPDRCAPSNRPNGAYRYNYWLTRLTTRPTGDFSGGENLRGTWVTYLQQKALCEYLMLIAFSIRFCAR